MKAMMKCEVSVDEISFVVCRYDNAKYNETGDWLICEFKRCKR
jgi:hypothetical protein